MKDVVRYGRNKRRGGKWRSKPSTSVDLDPPPKHVEDSEEDETPLQMREVEYKPGDRLFMTRILSELAAEDLRATSTISQKLAEGARRASETRKGLLTLPNCAKGFESVFAKEDFDILPVKGCKRELCTGTNKTMLCQLPIAC